MAPVQPIARHANRQRRGARAAASLALAVGVPLLEIPAGRLKSGQYPARLIATARATLVCAGWRLWPQAGQPPTRDGHRRETSAPTPGHGCGRKRDRTGQVDAEPAPTGTRLANGPTPSLHSQLQSLRSDRCSPVKTTSRVRRRVARA